MTLVFAKLNGRRKVFWLGWKNEPWSGWLNERLRQLTQITSPYWGWSRWRERVWDIGGQQRTVWGWLWWLYVSQPTGWGTALTAHSRGFATASVHATGSI